MMPHLPRPSKTNEVQPLGGLIHHNPQLIGSLQSVTNIQKLNCLCQQLFLMKMGRTTAKHNDVLLENQSSIKKYYQITI